MADTLVIVLLGNARAVHTRRWARRLAERGHDVHIVTDKAYELDGTPMESLLAGVPVHDVSVGRAPKRVGVRRLRRRRAISRLIRDTKADVLHAHGLSPYGEWLVSTRFAPLVQQAWGSDVLVAPARSKRARQHAERVMAAVDAVTVNSEVLAEAVRRLGAPPARVHRIGWGVDLRAFTGGRDTAFAESLGFGGRPLVVSPRGHDSVYNVDVIVEAIPHVQEHVRDAAFLFMARGSTTSGLKRRVAELGVEDSVHFQRFAEADLPAVYSSADVVVSIPSSDSGAPASVLEAMASRVPLVIPDIAGPREFVTQARGGEVVPVRDVQATAAAIVRLLTDPDLRRAYGARNRAVIEERADSDRETDKAERLYRALATRAMGSYSS